MITDSSNLLIHLHQPLLELLACVMLGTGEPSEFLCDIRMELVIIPQAEQIGLDKVKDMLLDEVSGDRVAFWTPIFMASLVGTTGVVARFVTLSACPSRPGESATTNATDHPASQEVVALHSVAAMVGMFGFGISSQLLDSIKGCLVNQCRPSILTDDPIGLGAMLDALILAFNT